MLTLPPLNSKPRFKPEIPRETAEIAIKVPENTYQRFGFATMFNDVSPLNNFPPISSKLNFLFLAVSTTVPILSWLKPESRWPLEKKSNFAKRTKTGRVKK